MVTLPLPVKINETFSIDWLLDRVRKDNQPCFEGKTAHECELVLLRLKYDRYNCLTIVNGETVAV